MSILLTSQTTVVASGTDAIEENVETVRRGSFLLNVTAAAAGGTDTLDVYLQHAIDDSTWNDFVHFTQVLGNGGAKKFIAHWNADLVPTTPLHAPADGALAAGVLQGPIGGPWRVKWVVAGAGADFDFTLRGALVKDR